MSKGLPKRSEDYSLWYNELVKRADLSRKFPSKRLYGDQTVWVFHLGKNAGPIG
jgi:hypothetical protein